MQGDGGVHRTSTEAERHDPAAFCILWRTRDAHVPDELSSALAGRLIRIIEADSPFAALAELCGLERELRILHRFPVRRPPIALLIHEPAHLDDKAEVLRAVERYAPRAHLWLYTPDTNMQRLRRVLPEDVLSWETPGSAVVVPANPDVPSRRPAPADLRLVGLAEGRADAEPPRLDNPSGKADSPEVDRPSRTPWRSRDVLSAEEIEVLLADDDSMHT